MVFACSPPYVFLWVLIVQRVRLIGDSKLPIDVNMCVWLFLSLGQPCHDFIFFSIRLSTRPFKASAVIGIMRMFVCNDEQVQTLNL